MPVTGTTPVSNTVTVDDLIDFLDIISEKSIRIEVFSATSVSLSAGSVVVTTGAVTSGLVGSVPLSTSWPSAIPSPSVSTAFGFVPRATSSPSDKLSPSVSNFAMSVNQVSTSS